MDNKAEQEESNNETSELDGLNLNRTRAIIILGILALTVVVFTVTGPQLLKGAISKAFKSAVNQLNTINEAASDASS